MPSVTPTNSPVPTLQGGPTGGTIRFTIIVPQANQSIGLIRIGEPVTNWDEVGGFDDIKIFEDSDNPIKAGEQITVDAPAGVWSITAWTPTLGGYNLYDAELLIDMREDTQWEVYKNPRWQSW